MDRTEKYILIVIIAVMGLSILVSLNTESCEDRGGKSKFTHMLMVPTKIGSTTVIQQIPQYKCEFN